MLQQWILRQAVDPVTWDRWQCRDCLGYVFAVLIIIVKHVWCILMQQHQQHQQHHHHHHHHHHQQQQQQHPDPSRSPSLRVLSYFFASVILIPVDFVQLTMDTAPWLYLILPNKPWNTRPVSTFHRNQCHPLLGGVFKYVSFFIPTWGDDPSWLTFFRWVETTNQIKYLSIESIYDSNLPFNSWHIFLQ